MKPREVADEARTAMVAAGCNEAVTSSAEFGRERLLAAVQRCSGGRGSRRRRHQLAETVARQAGWRTGGAGLGAGALQAGGRRRRREKKKRKEKKKKKRKRKKKEKKKERK